jgi:cysteine desulfuration protein SufE
MSRTITEELDALAEEFDAFGDDWEERYRYVIDLGRELDDLTDAERSEANKVRGCASQVWLVTSRGADGILIFHGDSDAHIVRGLIAIVISLYSGRAPDEILAFDFRAAFERLGLKGALSTQRSNGLFSMIERIRRDAAEAKTEAQAS